MSTAQSSFTRRLLQSRCRKFHTVFMQRGGNFGMPQIQEHPDRVAPAPRGHWSGRDRPGVRAGPQVPYG